MLSQIYLMTTDLERARAFYENALELTPSHVGESSVAYRSEECELKIQTDHDPEVLASFNLNAPPETGRGTGAVYVLTATRPVETFHSQVSETLSTVEGTVLTPPLDVPWGGTMFLVRSPDGYVFEIRESESA